MYYFKKCLDNSSWFIFNHIIPLCWNNLLTLEAPMNSLVLNCENNMTYLLYTYIREAFSCCVLMSFKSYNFIELLSHTLAFIVKIIWFFSFFNYRNCPEKSAITKAFRNYQRNRWMFRHFLCGGAGTNSNSNSFPCSLLSVLSVQLIVEL